MSDAPAPNPHDSWAEVYDRVYETIFGTRYPQLTQATLRVISERQKAPAKVIDFGAGTGRLSIPLFNAGYAVTAVEPSLGMCKVLERKAGARAEDPRFIICQSTAAEFRGDGSADIALCVFTVLLYLVDEAALRRTISAAASTLKTGGHLLIDIPSEVVFCGYIAPPSPGVKRSVKITPVPGVEHRYTYRDLIEVDGIKYEDEFPIRYWPRETVEAELRKAGLEPQSDPQLAASFSWTGSYYLWCRKL
jgi:SAM-dependent methyltransferase